MSLSGLLANPEEMGAKGDKTVNYAEDYSTKLANLRSTIDSLMSIWRGDAANAFMNSYESKSRVLDSFGELLEEMGLGVISASTILDKANQENARAGANLFGD